MKKRLVDVTPEEWDRMEPAEFQSIEHLLNHPEPHKFDTVENPEHYNNGSIECIDSMEAMLSTDEFIGYLRGNSHKYRWRFRYKNKPIEDLKKARWYEDRLLKFLLENEDVVG